MSQQANKYSAFCSGLLLLLLVVVALLWLMADDDAAYGRRVPCGLAVGLPPNGGDLEAIEAEIDKILCMKLRPAGSGRRRLRLTS